MQTSKPEGPVLLGAGGTILELLQTEQPTAPHPLVGLFCLLIYEDPHFRCERWRYQAHVHAVVGDVALLQYYDAAFGEPNDIRPLPLADLLAGSWRFFIHADDWRAYASTLLQNHWRLARAPREDVDV